MKKSQRSEWLNILVNKNYLVSNLESIECDGAQQIDGEWYIPLLGCDTLDHLLDDIDYAFKKEIDKK